MFEGFGMSPEVLIGVAHIIVGALEIWNALGPKL